MELLIIKRQIVNDQAKKKSKGGQLPMQQLKTSTTQRVLMAQMVKIVSWVPKPQYQYCTFTRMKINTTFFINYYLLYHFILLKLLNMSELEQQSLNVTAVAVTGIELDLSSQVGMAQAAFLASMVNIILDLRYKSIHELQIVCLILKH